MGLFTVLQYLIAPLVSLKALRNEESLRERQERNVKSIPSHLRQDIISDDRYWRND